MRSIFPKLVSIDIPTVDGSVRWSVSPLVLLLVGPFFDPLVFSLISPVTRTVTVLVGLFVGPSVRILLLLIGPLVGRLDRVIG